MTYRFICIDNGQAQEIESLLGALQDRSMSKINIERQWPTALEDLVATIQQASPDGLIIDLRLNLETGTEGQGARYHGTTVAQELRTRMSEGNIPPIPIVLWSTD